MRMPLSSFIWKRAVALVILFAFLQIYYSSRISHDISDKVFSEKFRQQNRTLNNTHPKQIAATSQKSQDDLNARKIADAFRLTARNKFCSKKAPGSTERYLKRLKPILSTEYFLIAVDFYNNQDIAPDFFLQLQEVISFIGVENVYVSIYENGSGDQTKTWLQFFELLLMNMGVKHMVQMTNDKKPKFAHRIAYLSQVRNNALKPIETVARKFDRVIFMNDIFFCADDIKELLYQSYLQHSDITCGIDYDTDGEGLGFYDTWVGRDMNGRLMNKRPLRGFVTGEKAANDRLKDDLPFQVECCWNGAAILNGKAFYGENKVRFRKRDTKDLSENDHRYQSIKSKFPGTRVYEECSSSEMNTLCKDFQRAGFKRAVMVPRVRVAYDWPTYSDLRETMYSMDSPFRVQEDQEIRFKELPESVVCMPMNGKGVRSPDGQTGEEVLL